MGDQGSSVFVHIVTFNSEKYIAECLRAVLASEGYAVGENLRIVVTDNSSSDRTREIVRSEFSDSVDLCELSINSGFAGGHNYGVRDFQDSDFGYFLILNPDVRLTSDALRSMVESFGSFEKIGAVTPKLLRADEKFVAVEPPKLDAAGMYLTTALRHFDRGSGELDSAEFGERGFVFGGTGACLMLSRICILDVILNVENPGREALMKVYPDLESGQALRAELFDEAFFAYREDAELSWRIQLLGWRCLYEPEAVGYHVRKVLPENRKELPSDFNLWSVRNRFLLQLNCFHPQASLKATLEGGLLRNLIVCIGVLLVERTSLGAFRDLFVLWRRARARRAELFSRARVSHRVFGRWFHSPIERV